MPTKKIGDIAKQGCMSDEHNPPSMMVWPDGIYEHTCPACGAKQVFAVASPRM